MTFAITEADDGVSGWHFVNPGAALDKSNDDYEKLRRWDMSVWHEAVLTTEFVSLKDFCEFLDDVDGKVRKACNNQEFADYFVELPY